MMPQLLAHLVGDYLLQSDWMAQNKRSCWRAANVHAFLYTLCFFPVICMGYHAHAGWCAVAIFYTHLLIDRFGLARYVVWAKNFIGPKGFVPPKWLGQQQRAEPRRYWPLADCPTGYAPDRPAFMSIWLLIIADNTIHLLCNYFALRIF